MVFGAYTGAMLQKVVQQRLESVGLLALYTEDALQTAPQEVGAHIKCLCWSGMHLEIRSLHLVQRCT